jgi:hypothetical protein
MKVAAWVTLRIFPGGRMGSPPPAQQGVELVSSRVSLTAKGASLLAGRPQVSASKGIG